MTLVEVDNLVTAQVYVLGSKYRKHVPLRLESTRLGGFYLFDFDEGSKRLAFVVNEVG
jgi:hypothetical protein